MNYFNQQLVKGVQLLTKSFLGKEAVLSDELTTYVSSKTAPEAEKELMAVLSWMRNPSVQAHGCSGIAHTLLHLIADDYWTHDTQPMEEKELTRFVRSFSKAFGVTLPYVAIQSPLPLDLETKKDMAIQLNKLYGLCFPIFQAEPTVLGGLRIFVDGVCIDNSWQKKVNDVFTSLRTYTH